MIQANELRIGNIFSLHSHEGYLGSLQLKAESIVIAQNDPKLFNETYCPYKLDEEWLVKLGFIPVDMMFSNVPFKRFNAKNKRFFVTKENNKYFLYLYNDREEPISILVQYVYQLQNLYFMLMGEELPVNHEFELK